MQCYSSGEFRVLLTVFTEVYSFTMAPAQKIKIALLQLLKTRDKEQNVKYAMEKIRQVVREYKPKVVVLPECFAGPYETQLFADHAEIIPGGYACQQMAKVAKELNIYVIGGLMEKAGDKIYNTCPVFGPQGNMLAKHRKVHLFDITMDEVQYRESDVLTPGDNITMVDIEGRKFGIAICYDMRLAEFARVYRNEGAEVMIYPAAFDPVQGKLHWDIILRARANDNQFFVVATHSARDLTDPYVLYGHSILIDPWGQILAEASEKEEVIVGELDFNLMEKQRRQIPLQEQRRTDVYDTIRKK